MDGRPNGKPGQRVLIVGGGVAGLEAALALRDLAGDRVEVAIRDPRDHFVYRPFSVGAPFGAARISRYPLVELAGQAGVRLERGSVVSVDEERGLARAAEGEELPYDRLLLASGVRMRPAMAGATTFWGVEDEAGMSKLLRRLRGGELRSLVFTLPPGCSWALPVYELALFAAAEMARLGRRGTRLTVVTPEERPLQLLGTHVAEQVSVLLGERGIELRTGVHPVKLEGGRLFIAPGGEVEADAVLSLPRLEGCSLPGLPADREGFLTTDPHGRVRRTERVFAAGDVTDFPVKQGGIATQQADAVAEAIAAELGCPVEPRPFDPILRGVLWTGERPRYLFGRLRGGQGETSTFSEESPWPDPHAKIQGRYLTPFLAAASELRGSATRASPADAGVRLGGARGKRGEAAAAK